MNTPTVDLVTVWGYNWSSTEGNNMTYKYYTIRMDAPGHYSIVGATRRMFSTVAAAKRYVDGLCALYR